jgi:type IV pilus assembly protein PilX
MTARDFMRSRHGRQRGVALLTALLLTLAVLMTGIAAARAAIASARVAGHERDRMLALHGAMAGLRDAEHDIEGGLDPGSVRAAALAQADPAAFADGCRGGAPFGGLCRHAAGEEIHAVLADPEGPGVVLGAFSGVTIPTGGALAARAPRYLIELMPSSPDTLLYRITALGFGSVETTQAAVQAYYRKVLPPSAPPPGSGGPPGAPPGAEPGVPAVPAGPDAPAAPEPEQPPAPGGGPGSGTPPPGQALPTGAPGSPGGPGIRVGWREIGNWQDSMVVSRHGERR